MRAWALACLFFASPAFAGDPGPLSKSEYEVGPRGVYFLPEDGSEGTWNPGVQARYFLGRRFGLEAAGDYQRHLFPNTTVHTAAGQLSLLAYGTYGRLRPLALAGMGYYVGRVHGPGYRRNIGRWGPHAGVGIELMLSPRWSVDAVYRHVWVADVETRDAAGNARLFKRSGDQVSFALNRRFGGI